MISKNHNDNENNVTSNDKNLKNSIKMILYMVKEFIPFNKLESLTNLCYDVAEIQHNNINTKYYFYEILKHINKTQSDLDLMKLKNSKLYSMSINLNTINSVSAIS